jgi:hypothetical protein
VLKRASGWFHQVENLEDTISINHNWVNSCCASQVFDFLISEQRQVIRELRAFGVDQGCSSEDEWREQCCIVMMANAGRHRASDRVIDRLFDVY